MMLPFPPKRVLRGSELGLAACTLGAGFAASYAQLLLARFGMCFFTGTTSAEVSRFFDRCGGKMWEVGTPLHHPRCTHDANQLQDPK